MKELHVMVGIPGSGKSTIAKQMLHDGQIDHIICPDDVRELLIQPIWKPGEDRYFNPKVEPDVWVNVWDRINEGLKRDRRVLLDATTVTPMAQEKVLFMGLDHGVTPIAHLVLCDYERCLAQNRSRTRKVPHNVMEGMRKNFDQYCSFERLERRGFQVVQHVNRRSVTVGSKP